jgi:hypothetical protein
MRNRRHRTVLAGLALAGLVLAGGPAAADEYDSHDAGHPLRLAAYVLHPVGVILDTLIARPAHWLVSRGPMKTLFGHEDRFGEAGPREYEARRAAPHDSPPESPAD